MVNLWVWAAGALAVAVAGYAVLRVRNRRGSDSITTEPVSGEWLANARAQHEEHGW